MLDDLRRFLAEVPILADLLQQAVYRERGTATNTEEQRYHLEALHQAVMADLKAERRVYGVLYNPEFENHDPLTKTIFYGHYLELNNPVTNKAIVSSTKLMNAFIHHEQTFITENMINVTGTRVGEMRMALDLAAIAGVLAGADVPESVLSEAHQASEIQAQQLAAPNL